MNKIKTKCLKEIKKSINRHLPYVTTISWPVSLVLTRGKSDSEHVLWNESGDSINDYLSLPMSETSSSQKNPLSELYQNGLKNFLEKLTVKPKEAKIWLKYFQTTPIDTGLPFAILMVTEDVFFHQKMMDSMAWSLAFLIQNNMNPLVIFEVSKQLRRHPGLLRGTEDCIEKRRVFGKYLQEKLAQFGANVELLFEDRNPLKKWQSSHSQREQWPQLTMNAAEISTCIHKHYIPILSNVMDGGDPEVENVLDVLEVLVARFRPMKTMILGTDRGIVDADNKVISDLAIPSDIPLIDCSDWLPPSQKYLLRRCASLVQLLPSFSSVILTSADTIIQELFTHHGSGTMIKCLEKITQYRTSVQLDKTRFKRLLEMSFGKTILDKYWDMNDGLIDTIYVSEKFSAAAVVLKLPGIDVPYLDKIAVHPKAQGTGLATGLWNEIVKDYPKLFWRSRRVNEPAATMYNAVSQGSWKTDNWTVFWFGLKSCEEVLPLVSTAINRPESFEKKPCLENVFMLSSEW